MQMIPSFTGWSNPPEILSVVFPDTDITLTWAQPAYTGGKVVDYFYRVRFTNNTG